MSQPDRAWTFVTAPIDQGIRHVGGRPGASQGSARLRERLEDADWVPSGSRFVDVEVANTAESLEQDLERLSATVADLIEADRLPVVLGGDHGTTFATVRGAARALEQVGVAYLDVHLDVRDFRPVHTSGSSFRRVIEEGWVPAERVRPLGIQEPVNPDAASGEKASYRELAAWANDQGIPVRGLEAVRRDPAGLVNEALSKGVDWCFSLDVDALDERYAPGVSAPGPDRLSLDQAVQAASAAHGRFRVLDVCEYSPRLDEGESTLESTMTLLEAALTGGVQT